MSLIDLILNIAGLLLWLNWQSARFDPLAKATALTDVGTLRKADPSRRTHWRYPFALIALLLIRAIFYRAIGSAVNWTPGLQFGVITLAFRSEFYRHMFLFSGFSFGILLFHFYAWLLLVVAVNRKSASDPIHKLIRLHLGILDRIPWVIKWLFPFLGGALIWVSFHLVFDWLGIVPGTRTPAEWIEQAVVLGIATYLVWQYLIVGLLLLHLVNSYVYLGDHPIWNYVNTTANNLTTPLRRLPLRVGKADFSPVVGIALVFLTAYYGEYLLTGLFQRLPLW